MTAKRYRPTVAQIDLGAIGHNVGVLHPHGAEVMAVVKANAYGHGAVPVAAAAVEGGATWLGVALVEEGLELRAGGLTAPIFVLTEFPPGSEGDALRAGLTPSVYTDRGVEALATAAAVAARPVGVHVKLDTGMHRVGLPPELAVPFVRRVVEAGLQFEGLWTHFAQADQPLDPFVLHQFERFEQALRALEAEGLPPPKYRHVANSAAIMATPAAWLNLVRLGVAMYGLAPGPQLQGRADLRPAMRWRSEVAMAKRVAAGEAISYGLRYRLERESTIATVPVGYADGYPRRLFGPASVLIRGRRYPLAGTVCMDQIMVDCGDDPVEPGDEVVLLGNQGGDEVTADEVAGWLGTINYEVVCGVGARVPRDYA